MKLQKEFQAFVQFLISAFFVFLEGLSSWSQPVMGNHAVHPQLSDPGTFSQHQPMERDDSGIVAPSNIFQQPMPNSFVDFSKVHFSVFFNVF